MRLPRRRFTPIAALVVVVATVASNASAFDYPSRPVQLIVGYAAGGPLDTGARLIAQELSKRLGQSFIVANHPGASGNLATEEVVRARPDGYTLLACSSANAWRIVKKAITWPAILGHVVPAASDPLCDLKRIHSDPESSLH
jgi:tripartite-type tricarboxylate transporter receptor subunit TctC